MKRNRSTWDNVSIELSDRVDFSSNAAIYDRRHQALLPREVVGALASAAELQTTSRVLDVGAGTGRVALALVDYGCTVVALEPSMNMLNELQRKRGGRALGIVCGEGGHLPFLPGLFDAIVFARVLYLIADWQSVLREASALLRPGGYFLHEWSNGDAAESWVQAREKLRTLFQEAGVNAPFHPGARTEADVDSYLEHLGMMRTAAVPAGPGPTRTLRSFINQITSGEVSYIWNVPERVRRQCLPEFTQWCDRVFDLDESLAIPRELQWTILRKIT